MTAATTRAVRMLSPAARHTEFVTCKSAAAEGAEYGLHLAAQVGAHLNALPAQCPMQVFGKRRAEDDVHAQLRQATGKRFGIERAEQNFPALHVHSTSSHDDEQARRRVEHRRHAPLPNGNGHDHE